MKQIQPHFNHYIMSENWLWLYFDEVGSGCVSFFLRVWIIFFLAVRNRIWSISTRIQNSGKIKSHTKNVEIVSKILIIEKGLPARVKLWIDLCPGLWVRTCLLQSDSDP